MCCCKSCSWFVVLFISSSIHPSIQPSIIFFVECLWCIKYGVPKQKGFLSVWWDWVSHLRKTGWHSEKRSWAVELCQAYHRSSGCSTVQKPDWPAYQGTSTFQLGFPSLNPKRLLCYPPILIDLLVVWQILAGVALPLHLYLRAKMFAWWHGVRFGDWI